MAKLAYKCLMHPVLALGYTFGIIEIAFRAGRRIAMRHIHKLYQD